MPDVLGRRSKLSLRAYGLINFFAHEPERAFVFSRCGKLSGVVRFLLAGVAGGD